MAYFERLLELERESEEIFAILNVRLEMYENKWANTKERGRAFSHRNLGRNTYPISIIEWTIGMGIIKC